MSCAFGPLQIDVRIYEEGSGSLGHPLYDRAPSLAAQASPHETQINAFLEMNRRPGKIQSSFSEVRKGCISGNSQ